jgi:hypothetical protein
MNTSKTRKRAHTYRLPKKAQGTKQTEEFFFQPNELAGRHFFTSGFSQTKQAGDDPEEKEVSNIKAYTTKHTEQAVKPPKPGAVGTKLAPADIKKAIVYNKKRFKNDKEIKILRDVLGLSPSSADIDEAFINTVVQWQSEYKLKEDGKIGPKTSAVIGYEMLKESKYDSALKPAAIKMLERGIVIALPGNSYTDTAASSKKNITFSAYIPKGLKRGNYALVNWVKGHMKNGKGGYFNVKMYGKTVKANFGSYQVDSVDVDPIYWSKPGARWNFNKVGSRKFTATDSPGPALNTEIGAEYDLNFKLQVYRLSDLPKTSSGNLGGAESKAIATVFWNYKVKVSKTGKFTH